jgi:hypothetical protein
MLCSGSNNIASEPGKWVHRGCAAQASQHTTRGDACGNNANSGKSKTPRLPRTRSAHSRLHAPATAHGVGAKRPRAQCGHGAHAVAVQTLREAGGEHLYKGQMAG